MILQIGFNRELNAELIARLTFIGHSLATKTLFPFSRRAIGHHAELAGESLTHERRLGRIIFPVQPFGVATDHFALQRAHGNGKWQCAGTRRNRNKGRTGLRMVHAIGESAHAAHGTTDDRMQSLDAEVQNNPVRRLGNVFHCQHREFQAVDLTGLRIYRSRSC